MKKTKDGDWVASDGTIISSKANPADLRRDSKEHANMAEKYRALADALRHGEDPADNRRYGFYQDSQGCWRDADHTKLTEHSYEDPLVQAHRLETKHRELSKDFIEASKLNSRPDVAKHSTKEFGPDGLKKSNEPEPINPFINTVVVLGILLILIYLASRTLF